jgi:YHS domain-containing protein
LPRFRLEILPIFFQFCGHDQLCVPTDAIDTRKVAEWVDAKLLEFVDTYLRVPTVEGYHQGNMVKDPVCAMQVNRALATLQSEFEGQKFYFCSEGCRQKFALAPSRYVVGKSV